MTCPKELRKPVAPRSPGPGADGDAGPLVKGYGDAHICAGCVALAAEAIAEHRSQPTPTGKAKDSGPSGQKEDSDERDGTRGLRCIRRPPKATDHRNDCSGSNESGQPGSAYVDQPPPAPPPAGDAGGFLPEDLPEMQLKIVLNKMRELNPGSDAWARRVEAALWLLAEHPASPLPAAPGPVELGQVEARKRDELETDLAMVRGVIWRFGDEQAKQAMCRLQDAAREELARMQEAKL